MQQSMRRQTSYRQPNNGALEFALVVVLIALLVIGAVVTLGPALAIILTRLTGAS